MVTGLAKSPKDCRKGRDWSKKVNARLRYDLSMPKKETDRLSELRKRVSKAPADFGIYKWLDEGGRVLYVGKAKNLRKRLASYVAPPKKSDGPWKLSFKEQITDFDITVTTSELEALLLETNLIKQLRPKYNVLMKDDKNYLFIRITIDDPYPHVEMVRRYEKDGAKYFGPFLNSESAYGTLELLHLALQYRACKHSLEVLNRGADASTLKECLEFQIGRCCGLCAGAITQEDYRRRIDEVLSFLKGNQDHVKKILDARMREAAKEKKFETAAKIRNHLLRLEGKQEQQLVTDTSGDSSDALGVAVLSNRAHVVILHQRSGRVIGESHFVLSGQAESISSVLEQFLPQFYDEGQEVPPVVMLPDTVEDAEVLEELLRKRRSGAVELLIPKRGRKSRLVQLAERNARMKAKQMELKWEAQERNSKSAMEQLKEILHLPSLPKRIEGYDISHLGGTETVGSMVVMKDGKAANDQYRSFTIRTLKRGDVDDYRAIKEVLTRRLRRLTEDLPAEEKKWNEGGVTFGKGLKSEQKTIEEIHVQFRDQMNDIGIRYKDYLVARHDNEIIGFGRLYKHPQGTVELKSIWIQESFQGGRLGQFIARKILRSVKKGKVYITVQPALENYYAQLGFRYVINAPKAVVEQIEDEERLFPEAPLDIPMMWEAHQNKIDPSLTARPDLIVIDGGKGQLSTAVEVLTAFQVDIPVIGLAKREEEIFVPGQSNPIPFPADSPAKFLLMRLRDEAHRFSNAHREKRAGNAMTASSLEEIPGIGEDTMKKLYAKFGSLSEVRQASDEDLMTILTKAQLESLRSSH